MPEITFTYDPILEVVKGYAPDRFNDLSILVAEARFDFSEVSEIADLVVSAEIEGFRESVEIRVAPRLGRVESERVAEIVGTEFLRWFFDADLASVVVRPRPNRDALV